MSAVHHSDMSMRYQHYECFWTCKHEHEQIALWTHDNNKREHELIALYMLFNIQT